MRSESFAKTLKVVLSHEDILRIDHSFGRDSATERPRNSARSDSIIQTQQFTSYEGLRRVNGVRADISLH